MSEDHRNYSITEIGQNTKKSPGDLKRLAVTQTPVEKPPANTVVKNSQMSKIKRNEESFHKKEFDAITDLPLFSHISVSSCKIHWNHYLKIHSNLSSWCPQEQWTQALLTKIRIPCILYSVVLIKLI